MTSIKKALLYRYFLRDYQPLLWVTHDSSDARDNSQYKLSTDALTLTNLQIMQTRHKTRRWRRGGGYREGRRGLTSQCLLIPPSPPFPSLLDWCWDLGFSDLVPTLHCCGKGHTIIIFHKRYSSLNNNKNPSKPTHLKPYYNIKDFSNSKLKLRSSSP